MSTKSATIAKSLHTVTALVNVARREMVLAAHDDAPISPAHAVRCALATLGYSDASDPYGLAAKALDVLRKEAAKAAASAPARDKVNPAYMACTPYATDAGRL